MPLNRGNALLRGSKLQGGRYVIEDTLGAGGFGITYRASDTKLHRTVAIKELYPGGSARQGNTVTLPSGYTQVRWHKVVTDFIREAETLASLNHPTIVTVHDYFEENGTAYMVMRFIDGMNLAQRMKQNGGPLPEDEVLHYASQVGNALEVIHSRGLLHRDIKPSNIMLDRRAQAILVDFGSAREFVSDQAQTHTVMATRGFAPPEQFHLKAPRGPFTDIYALAATCYYLLTGSLPNTDPEADKKLPPAMLVALDHGMAYNPQQRPKNVSSFIAELRRSATSASGGFAARRPSGGATGRHPIVQPRPPVQRRRGSPLPLIAGAVMAIALLVALAFLLLDRSAGGSSGNQQAVVATASPTVAAAPSATVTPIPADAMQQGTVVVFIVPPTNTPPPPTDTPLPLTDTPVLPTDTPLLPTDTPRPPTDTPRPPADTRVPPTRRPVPPTYTPRPRPTRTPIPRPTATTEQPRTVVVSVDAQSVQHTGLVVQTNQLIVVTYLDGSWTHDAANYQPYDAGGISTVMSDGCHQGALIASIDNGSYICVGKGSSWRADTAGELVLQMDDSYKVDNAGVIRVRVDLPSPLALTTDEVNNHAN